MYFTDSKWDVLQCRSGQIVKEALSGTCNALVLVDQWGFLKYEMQFCRYSDVVLEDIEASDIQCILFTQETYQVYAVSCQFGIEIHAVDCYLNLRSHNQRCRVSRAPHLTHVHCENFTSAATRTRLASHILNLIQNQTSNRKLFVVQLK